MLRRIFTFGGLAGLIVGGLLFGTSLTWAGGPPPSWGAAAGYAGMLIALSLVFVGVKRQRDEAGGGVIRFWPALLMGLGISAVAGVLYVLAWEAALAVTGMDFAKDYGAMVIEQKRAAGASAEALAKLEADMAAFAASYANPLMRMPMTFAEIFPVGVIVSLVSAALLRNPRFLPARAAA